jgi:uncharacterized membrane protein
VGFVNARTLYDIGANLEKTRRYGVDYLPGIIYIVIGLLVIVYVQYKIVLTALNNSNLIRKIKLIQKELQQINDEVKSLRSTEKN